MTDREDIAAVAPMLQLTLDYMHPSLRCAGTLDARTRGHVLEAAEVLFARRPSRIVIDITDLHIADVDGANALAHLQRMARDARAVLRWQGLDADRLRGLVPLRHHLRRPGGLARPRGGTARTGLAAC